MEVEPLLRTNRLAARQDGPRSDLIFEEIGLEVARGEIVCLLGASGCGKSSLLRTMAGLQPSSAGETLLGGMRVDAPCSEIGFVFQKPLLLPWLDLRGNIAFGLDLKCMPKLASSARRARVEEALDEVGLRDAGTLYPAQLSGGMAQRASLARTLARRPSALLLDEPLGALDAITRLEMQQLLLELAARHRMAVLWATHDIDEALFVADRIMLMDRRPGRLAARWDVPTSRPRSPGSAELVALRGDILDALSRVSGILRRSEAAPLP